MTYFDLTLDSLAVYRLTRLIVVDEISDPLRQRVFSRFGSPAASKISYLVTCPWCVSIYAGAAVATARMMAPGVWSKVAPALATSAVTGIIAEQV